MQNATVQALTKNVQTTRKEPTARPSKIGALWDLFDAAEGVVTSKHLPDLAEQTMLHPTTVRIQFYAWRATRAS